MIIGCFYAHDNAGGEDKQAIPIFVNDRLEIVGFSGVDHDEMRFIISWASKDVEDDVIEVVRVDGVHFLSLFANMYYPRKGTPIPTLLSMCLFRGLETSSYILGDIYSALEDAEIKQRKYWDDKRSIISKMIPSHKQDILDAYAFYGDIKATARGMFVDEEIVKLLVYFSTGEYIWE